MTAAALPLSAVETNRALGRLMAAFALGFGAFLSGFVIAEPAPYELYMAGLIAIWALAGLRFPAAISPLIALLVLFNIGGIISMMTMERWLNAPLYVAVSFFLALTSIFFAAVIAADHKRLHTIMAGYTVAALITGTAGIVGYFGIVPGAEVFTRYGRAMGVFQDPNVFAPFLSLPALYTLHGILTGNARNALARLPVFVVLAFAIFLSFSRAGWGLFAVSVILLSAMLMIVSPSNRFRLRIIVLAIAAVALLAVALLVALQNDTVRTMLIERARFQQDYDSARLGRFARHWIGFMMATEKPFGIGPLMFGRIFGEDTHNIWLKALFDYSWLGFASYVTLLVWTLAAGFRLMFRDRPWQPFLMCAWIVLVGHTLIGNVIDTDHWRHFYLLFGIIWGAIALEAGHQARIQTRNPGRMVGAAGFEPTTP